MARGFTGSLKLKYPGKRDGVCMCACKSAMIPLWNTYCSLGQLPSPLKDQESLSAAVVPGSSERAETPAAAAMGAESRHKASVRGNPRGFSQFPEYTGPDGTDSNCTEERGGAPSPTPRHRGENGLTFRSL